MYLVSLTLPDTVITIEVNAFSGCTELRSITLGPILPALEGTGVFKNVKLLSTIYVPATAVTRYETTDKANWTSDLKEKVQALP
ncbi:MAG: leucine-rich repeat domain-containing protein [Treponema sp.]|nr:leucine-rich repeat domain-containing protein [Treponema sp.]